MNSTLKDYQLLLSTYPVLTSEEQKRLAILAKDGDSEARNSLINCNLRLVYKIFQDNFAWASKNDEDTLDLLQAGNKGLIRAINDFDVNAGVAFSTYAKNKIFNDIQQQFESEARMIHIPANVQAEINKIYKVSKTFSLENGYDPSCEEISELMGDGYTEDKIHFLLNCAKEVDSLDRNLSSDSDDTYTYSDLYGDNEDVNIVNNDLLKDETFNLYKKLSKEEAYIISSLFGVFNIQQKSVAELSRELKIPTYKLNALSKSILEKMRQYADEIGYQYFALQA